MCTLQGIVNNDLYQNLLISKIDLCDQNPLIKSIKFDAVETIGGGKTFREQNIYIYNYI